MPDRIDTILSHVPHNARVLDIGCIGNPSHHLVDKKRWLFHRLSLITNDLVGIDTNQDWVKKAHQAGYTNILLEDAQNYRSPVPFDVITAGELIEHLPNPADFISAASACLSPNGLLIISTPNIFSLNYSLKGLLGIPNNFHSEHLVAFDEQLIRAMLHRCAFTDVSIEYATERDISSMKNYFLTQVAKIRPRWSGNLVAVARKG
ncbi:bifunctional 2-polyprenyl-6-hydroxyphenol methylase/3-demethylubiquinol 3-O-methyltransferase UbiG [Synechococcus sp. LA31]|uniref:class I SAM-dependent methyltransferase n=1 Tax=Synechococcus sp. LA31 TaxID=2741953 RepID=UPI001BDD1073|nr:methyltransferase domain-containing protein [Synechococcus sp. LA31]QVV68734.1 methyltransferase domain-containing protein [Synechococcus sp. LA31]